MVLLENKFACNAMNRKEYYIRLEYLIPTINHNLCALWNWLYKGGRLTASIFADRFYFIPLIPSKCISFVVLRTSINFSPYSAFNRKVAIKGQIWEKCSVFQYRESLRYSEVEIFKRKYSCQPKNLKVLLPEDNEQ